MATVYSKCDAAVGKLVNKIVEKHFKDFQECELTVACLFANAGVEVGEDGKPVPAVKAFGRDWPIAIKQNGLRDRVEGKSDVTITIDELRWKDMEKTEQEALIHHALCQLAVKRDDAGQIETDDVGRPKLRKVPPDWIIAGYQATARAYEAAAPEVQEAVTWKDDHGQHLFEFAAGVG